MNEEQMQMAARAISHSAHMVQVSWQEAAWEQMRPSVLFKPAVSIDGDQWCALYGENLQDGVAGFGESPGQAMADFDKNWNAKMTKENE